MIYPIAVIVIAAVVVGVILWKVIPTFAALFCGPRRRAAAADAHRHRAQQQPGAVLPVPVRRRRRGRLVRSARYYATESGRASSTRCVLKMPVLGNIMRKIAVARFCRTLSTLISSGVPILDGLEITAQDSGNADRRGRDHGDPEEHRARRNHLRAAEGDGVFPPMVTQMIGVGEATGALDTMLGEDCRLLRRRSRHGRRRPADTARADHDRLPRRGRRRHRHRDVHADLRHDQQADA